LRLIIGDCCAENDEALLPLTAGFSQKLKIFLSSFFFIGNNVIYSKAGAVPSEKPARNQQSQHSSGIKITRKKLYVVAAVIVIAVVAVALLIPQGAAIIPLNVEYTVGEKMMYQTAEPLTYQPSNATTVVRPFVPDTGTVDLNATATVEVIAFDGETYTLNRTMTLDTGTSLVTASLIEKVNKTGYSTYLLAEGNALASNASSNSLTALLERPEVKVGESWQIPLDSSNENVSITGDMTLTFGGIQNITVPAGTYTVFRIDMSSSNVIMTTKTHASNSTTSMSSVISSSGETYIEYGTGRQIAYSMENTVYNEEIGLNYTLSANTTLVQHIKP